MDRQADRVGDGGPVDTHPSARAWARVLAWAVASVLGPFGVAGAGEGEDSPRLATRSNPGAAVFDRATASARVVTVSPSSRSPVVDTTLDDAVAAANRAIAACQARFAGVEDYTCRFVKRERIDGKLAPQHVMVMKARNRPTSFYFKFQTPNKGREAIFVAGRHKDHVLAHDVGLFKVLAGTMQLDPRGEMAMDGCRHPITEAGVGALIDTVAYHWKRELTPAESRVAIVPDYKIGATPCTMIETVHPRRDERFMFHMVRLYIAHDLGLPVRFEAYDWPRSPGAAAELVEEYTYADLKLNVGLTDRDFDPGNRGYSFGRF